MMKKLCIIILTAIVGQLYTQIVFEQKYNTLNITGEMKSLTILGEDRKNTTVEFFGKGSKTANYDVLEKPDELHFEIAEPKMDVIIRVPKSVNLEIEPYDIVFEGIFDMKSNPRNISIKDIEGSIDVTTDGYEVDLLRNSNDMSVVSYFNIFADSIEVRDGGSISMDSYWGDVKLQSINPLDAQISMRAKHGMAQLDSMIVIAEKQLLLNDNIEVIVGNGSADILLHSEKGNHVLLNMQDMNVQMKEIENELFRVNEDIRIINATDKPGSGIDLLQNEPNPWKKETKIQYFLPEDKSVFFKFYKVDGTTIYTVLDKGKKGMNSLMVNRKQIPNIGVVYYEMEVGDFKETRKMIHID